MSLPNSGTFAYNGVNWASLYKSKVEVKPVKDSAGRALVAREYTLDVEGRIAATPGSTTDQTLAAMRIALEKPAGALLYTSKGFGPLQVNVPGGQVWDAAYGPWPEVLAWDPIGNDQGCLVRWKCSTLIPCEENPKTRGIIEYVWTESWDIDEDGYSTRSIEGHVTVQATRNEVDDRSIPDNADAYREQVVPDLPIGFQREQNFKLSEDRRTLEFRLVDTELAQPLPNGLTRAEVHHKATWRRPGAGTSNNCTETINGTLTVPARAPKSFVRDKILMMLRAKWPIGAAAIATRKGLLFLLDHFEIDDEMFGRSSSFSASVRIVGAIFPSQLLAISGLWKPLPGTNFVAWKQSVFQANGAGKPYSPRGAAGMSFQNGDDAIVDLCGNTAVLKANPSAPGRGLKSSTPIPRQLNGMVIPPQNTWLQYRLRLRLLEDDRVIRHKPLNGNAKLKAVAPLDGFITSDYQDSPGLKPPQDNEIGSSFPNSGDVNDPGGQGVGYTTPSAAADLTQKVSAPSYTIRLEGYAVRIGYGIPTPRLASVGGVDVTQLDQDVSQEQISAIGITPIYGARWRIDYALPYASEEELPMPVNAAMW